MKETPGANMEEARGEMKVMAEMRKRSMNFLPSLKLSGMLGSSWPSQPTMPSSRFCTGMSVGSSFSLVVAMRDSTRVILLLFVSVLLSVPASEAVLIKPWD